MTVYYTIAENLRVDYRELAQQIITPPRLRRYGSLNPSDLPETVARCLWDMGLCEALYPLLNGLEVALRNRAHAELTRQTGLARWMDPGDPRKAFLGRREKDQVRRAINLLRRDHEPTNVSRIVGVLTFGFWASLFAPRYEQRAWHGDGLRGVFPYAPRQVLGCHLIRARLRHAVYMRNRVFHHEPIWHLAALDNTHREITELIGWLSTDWGRALAPYDRFHQVHSAGYRPYLDKLRTM